jgi:hypothetical protein
MRRLPEYPALSGIRAQVAGQDVEKRGLAGAVFPQQAHYAAAAHIETEVFVDEPVAIVMGYFVTFYYSLHDHEKWCGGDLWGRICRITNFVEKQLSDNSTFQVLLAAVRGCE